MSPERRANTPKQKREVLRRLLALWEQHPTLRLMQLILNADLRMDPYYVEDLDLIERMQEWYARLEVRRRR